ncbi:hypothetical protein CPB86DRAFT_741167 [Serendipita vermifera]|nr:hypothetical protein CPB86DRAFT_741167 [Serendipita vermifera]
MSAPPECLAPNPDVSGIGIRIAFYINTILIASVPRHPPFTKLLEPLQTNNGLNGLALLVTAVAQSASSSSRSLSLYHAIIVLHMLTFLGIATSTAGDYKATTTRLRILAVTSWCAMIAYFYLVLRVWITVQTFGSQPECNDWTIYVIFFANVRATVPWLHWLIVALACIALLQFLYATMRTITSLEIFMRPKGENDADSSDSDSMKGPSLITRCLPCSTAKRRTPGLIARLGASIYSVVMLELTIKRNPSSDEENVWSFGQIIALLITLMTVNEILHFILGEYLGLNLGERIDQLIIRIRTGRWPHDEDSSRRGHMAPGDVELGNGKDQTA